MKITVQFIITILLCVLLQWYFPWYVAAIAGFIGGLSSNVSRWLSFLIGFVAVFIVWGAYALIIDVQNASVLSTKIAVLFKLNNVTLLLLATSIIGGITGGLGAWLGSEVKKLIRR